MTGLTASAIEQLEQDLSKLAEASREELVDLWNVAYGRPPPKGLSRRLLEHAAAYEMQARLAGENDLIARQARSLIAELYERWGKPEAALHWR